jgi:hypothetical protein
MKNQKNSANVQMLSDRASKEIFTRYPLRPQIYTEYPTNGRPSDDAYKIGNIIHEFADHVTFIVEDMEDELWQSSTTLMLAYNKMMDAQNISTIVETSTAFEISHWPVTSPSASN